MFEFSALLKFVLTFFLIFAGVFCNAPIHDEYQISSRNIEQEKPKYKKITPQRARILNEERNEKRMYSVTDNNGNKIEIKKDKDGTDLNGFYEVNKVSNFRYIVSLYGGKRGIIDNNGNYVVEPKYDMITSCGKKRFCAYNYPKGGQAVYSETDGNLESYLLDNNGKVLMEYYDIESLFTYGNDVSLYMKSDKNIENGNILKNITIFDKNLKEIVKVQSYARPRVYGNYIVITQDGNYVYLDLKGNKTNLTKEDVEGKPKYAIDEIKKEFHSLLYRPYDKIGKYYFVVPKGDHSIYSANAGVCNKFGIVIIPLNNWSCRYAGGYFYCRKGAIPYIYPGTFTIYDKQGKIVFKRVPPKSVTKVVAALIYNDKIYKSRSKLKRVVQKEAGMYAEFPERGRFYEEKNTPIVFAVARGDKTYLFDADGKNIIKQDYDYLSFIDFSGDYIREKVDYLYVIEKDGKCGIINSKGELLVPIMYEEITNYKHHIGEENLFTAKLNGKYGIINLKNEVVYDFKYNFPPYYVLNENRIITKKVLH